MLKKSPNFAVVQTSFVKNLKKILKLKLKLMSTEKKALKTSKKDCETFKKSKFFYLNKSAYLFIYQDFYS